MLLYHGTSEYAALEALKNGLRPRKLTGVSNWDHTSPSNPNVVYLMDTYACHFALHAQQNGVRLKGPDGKIQNRAAVIEIDTRRLPFSNFLADEDFLAFREAYSGRDINVSTAVAKTRSALTHEWKESLKFIGNCSYADLIPPSSFTRVAFFNPKTNIDMAIAMTDGSVNPSSYKFAGHYHRAYTRWLFGDPVTAIEILGYEGYSEESLEFDKPRIEYWEQNILAKREGVEIIECKKY